MTGNEAREAIKLEGCLEITGSPARLVKFFEGLEVADKALEEVQQYRDTKLSPKQVRTLQEDVTGYLLQADEYRAIGTVEECRAAMEKQGRKPVKNPYGTSYIWKAGYCPVCGCGVTARWDYCQSCGQKLNWED